MPQRVLGIVSQHENQALVNGTTLQLEALRAYGYEPRLIDLTHPENYSELQRQLAGGEVAFCFGVQGVGSRLVTNTGENLWSLYRTPFLGIHHDHPCHNILNHINDSRYVANLYTAPSFLETSQRYIVTSQYRAALPLGYFYHDNRFEPPLRFADRPIRFLFIKSGAALDEPKAAIDATLPALRDPLWQAIAAAERNPDLLLCDLVAAAFAAAGLDHKNFTEQFWGLTRIVDIYLRRKRAIAMVEWLKRQDGAVIVGNGWDFIDRDDARAVFKPEIPVAETWQLYGQAHFCCNTSPYGRDLAHERVAVGLLCGSHVIGDRNHFWAQRFGDLPSLTLFDGDRPLADQLDPVVARMESSLTAYDTTIGQKRAADYFWCVPSLEKLIDHAHTVRTYAENAGAV
jgi:hypothetical protein